MSEPVTHEEMDGRLEAAEARTETRFVQLVGKIDALGGQIVQVHQYLGGQIIQVRQELGQVRQDLGGQVAEVSGNLGGQMAEVLADNKFTRQTIMWVTITAMLTVIAVVIQVGLMNAFSAGAARQDVVTAAAAILSQLMGPAPPAISHSGQAPASAPANTSG